MRNAKTGVCKKLQIDKDGYYTVTLWKDGKYYFKRINRLVAEAFIPNYKGLPIVNHKDENKKNNHVDNLEWCTVSYNNIYSKARPVVQLDLDGNFVSEFPSSKAAGEVTGFAYSHIHDCCSPKKVHCKTFKGYQWVYKEDYDPNKNYKLEKVPSRYKNKTA